MSTRRHFITGTVASGLMLGSALSPRASAESALPDAGFALRTYQFPNTDLRVSRLAYGCALLGTASDSADLIPRTSEGIEAAYDRGITFFDLADIYGYGNAETAMGQILKQSPGMRHRIVIQTKCGDRLKDTGGVDNRRGYILRSVDGSLERLGVDYIDILLLHWPDSLVEPEEVAKAFDELQEKGKVRYFGVSNHNPMQIELLRKFVRQPLITNQILLSLVHWYVITVDFKVLFMHGYEGVATVDYCRTHEMLVQAYSPLRGTVRGPNVLGPGKSASPELTRAMDLLAKLATKYEVTPAAIMLAWLLRHPAGIVPVLGTANPKHIHEDCMADGVTLEHEEWYALLGAAGAIQLARAV